MRRIPASLALLVVGVLLAFAEVLGPATLMLRDHQLAFRPRWWAIRDSLLRGELPALTVGGHAGIPIEQIMNGTFTPGGLAIFLGPFGFAYDLLVAVHYLILVVGAWLLARRLGAGEAAAIGGAAVATLAGPVISTESLGVLHIGLAYTPWVLLAWHRLVCEPDGRGVAFLGLAIGCQVQAIIPSVLLIDIVGALFLLARERERVGVRTVVSAGIAAALGLCVGAIGLFPALEGLAATTRASGFGYGASSGWAVSPAMFVEYVAPVFWSPPDVPFLNPGEVTGNPTDPAYFPSLYFGTALPLLVVGATGRRRWPLVAVLVFFAVVAMGRYTPVHRFVASLPILSSSRYAVKYTLLVAASASCLAALGLGDLEGRARAARNIAVVYAVVVLVVAIGTHSGAFFDRLVELHRFGANRWGLGGSMNEVAEIARSFASAHAWHAVVFALALAAALQLRVRTGGSKWATVAALVVLFDLAVASTYVVVGVDADAGRLPDDITTKLVAEPPPPYFVALPTEAGDLVDLSKGDFAEQIVAEFARRGQIEVPGARRFNDLELEGQSHPFHVVISRLAHKHDGAVRERILRRAGVTRLLVPKDRLQIEPIDGQAYVSAHAQFVAFDPTVWREAHITKFLSDPEMLDAALVERGPRTSTTACGAPPNVEWKSAGPNGPVDVTVRSECETAVVLRELLKRGWSVEVDGEEVSVYAMDAGYVGAFVPAGEHQVRFEYRSLAAQWAPMSLVAILAALLLILRGGRSRDDTSLSLRQ